MMLYNILISYIYYLSQPKAQVATASYSFFFCFKQTLSKYLYKIFKYKYLELNLKYNNLSL